MASWNVAGAKEEGGQAQGGQQSLGAKDSIGCDARGGPAMG